jgi:hypothetical protein
MPLQNDKNKKTVLIKRIFVFFYNMCNKNTQKLATTTKVFFATQHSNRQKDEANFSDRSDESL